MGQRTAIEWTDATFNPWWGCTKIGPGCDSCYAATFDRRVGGAHWGAGVPRRYFGDEHWNAPLRWNRQAEGAGRRRRFFCASMADVFDNEIADEHRARLWRLVRATPFLDWQIVTKRIGNARRMLPRDWGSGYPNVWLLSTTVTQEEAERDMPKLMRIPARVHGLSVEPQLEAIDLRRLPRPNWIIVGGESGARRRPFDPDWARSLREQCRQLGIAFFMKQVDKVVPIPRDLRVRQFPA